MASDSFSFEHPFNLKLEQLDSQDTESRPKIISSIFITSNTLQKICEKERVLAWSLPLASLQRKIGETGRFVLPDKSIIDDVVQFTLHDYRRYQINISPGKQARFPSVLVVNWLQQKSDPNDKRKEIGAPNPEGESQDEDSQKIPSGPMKERDWDYVFQANKILSCSYVDPFTSQVLRAPHAAFRLRTSNEDDAEPDLPQDDERAKIPVWKLSKEPSRAYIHETNTELETSAMISGHSKKSLEVGLSGAYKIINAEGKYGRTTENAYKNTSDYGKKQSTMLTIYEIPLVELNLDKGSSRISDACRQALLKLRHERQFDDLMDFFAKYGTMYSKKVVLGGRLVNSQKFWEETMAETNLRQQSARNNASLSVGIDPFSIKGSYSDEHGTKTKNEKKEKTDQLFIDWAAIGGNPGYVSNPEKWLPTVPDYKFWKVIQNIEVVAIQNFIGSLPGYDDIPGLFQEILDGGLYNPNSLHLGPRPALPGQNEPALDSLDTAPLGAGIDTFTMGPTAPRKSAFTDGTLQYKTSRTIARGGCSWQILDTTDAVKLEIASTMRSLTNTSANRSAIPSHLYSLSMKHQNISIVLQWTSDLIETGLNLGTQNVSKVVQNYTTLNKFVPQQCSAVLQAAKSLKWDEGKLAGKDSFNASMDDLAKYTQDASLAAFRVASWRAYFEDHFKALEAGELKSGHEVFLKSIKNAITTMPDEDMGQQSSTMLLFNVTPQAQTLLTGTDKAAFIAALGYQFVESYTEKASLTAVWRIHLPEPNNEEFYALRMLLQKYFLGPRSVREVCDFLADHDNSFQDIEPEAEVTVSIYGYRDEFTNEPVDLNDKDPSLAYYYLNQDALLRNQNRVSITMHPWKGIEFENLVMNNKSVANNIPPVASNIPPVAPEEFFVLNVQKAEYLLLLLKLYSDDPNSHIDPENLKQFGKTLDKVLDPNNLDRETGNMSQNSRVVLTQLVRNLEKTLEF